MTDARTDAARQLRPGLADTGVTAKKDIAD